MYHLPPLPEFIDSMASEEQIVTMVPPPEEPEGADGADGHEDPALGHGGRPKYVGWEGSNVHQIEIDWLYKTKHVPTQVSCRLPKGELEPTPEEGEIVVFLAHFARGFGSQLAVSSGLSSTSSGFSLTIFQPMLLRSCPPSLLSPRVISVCGPTLSYERGFTILGLSPSRTHLSRLPISRW
jgi:hypothetical protein